jgi:hypothetical protein
MDLFKALSQLFELSQTDAGRNFTSNAVKTITEVAKNKTVQNVVFLGGGLSAGVAIYKAGENKGHKKGFNEGHEKGFKEGYTKGEEGVRQNLQNVLSMVRSRDEFILLAVKIAVHIAKCDSDFSFMEHREIDRYIGQLNSSPIVPQIIKDRIEEIKNSNLSFDQLVAETKSFLHQYCNVQNQNEVVLCIQNLIIDMIHADGKVHPAEEEFLTSWQRIFPV